MRGRLLLIQDILLMSIKKLESIREIETLWIIGSMIISNGLE